MDPCLTRICHGERRDAGYWVETLGHPEISGNIRKVAISRLMRHGILEPERDNFLTLARRVVRSRRYVMVDGKVEREVELRIMEALFNEDIPDTRDIMLISLVDACGLFKRLLTREERAEVEERLDLIRNLDLLGRTVFKVIGEAGKPAEEETGSMAPRCRHSGVAGARPDRSAPGREGGVPIAGNAFDMAGDLVGFLAEQYGKLGPVFRVRAFSRAYTVLAGPEANLLLQRKGRVYFRNLKVYEGVAEGFGAHRIVLSMDGRDHFQLRLPRRKGHRALDVQSSRLSRDGDQLADAAENRTRPVLTA